MKTLSNQTKSFLNDKLSLTFQILATILFPSAIFKQKKKSKCDRFSQYYAPSIKKIFYELKQGN